MPDPVRRSRSSELFARNVLRPLERFVRIESSSGIVLLLTTALALIWANSPLAESYDDLWHAPLTLGVGPYITSQSLHFWINDGLMTIFFLVVGLEIRREMRDGALSSLRLASVPIAAALGGVAVPALIYVFLNPDPLLLHGWAVPTATDIAFAVGVLVLLGKRVPVALRVLLLAIAIIDDIAAILIIALFYSSGIDYMGLLIAGAGIALVLLWQQLGFTSAFSYIVPGIVVWGGMLYAGIHPALGGVVLGLMTPVSGPPSEPEQSPLARVESALHPWVAYFVIPLFALANAGVNLNGALPALETYTTLFWGIAAGLVIGKPLGIGLVTWLALTLRFGSLPPGVDARGVILVGTLAGIGFTMSVFIANLAFADEALLSAAKLAVLAGSLCAAVIGLAYGRIVMRAPA